MFYHHASYEEYNLQVKKCLYPIAKIWNIRNYILHT